MFHLMEKPFDVSVQDYVENIVKDRNDGVIKELPVFADDFIPNQESVGGNGNIYIYNL